MMVKISTFQGKQDFAFYLMKNQTKINFAVNIIIYYVHQIYKKSCLVDANLQISRYPVKKIEKKLRIEFFLLYTVFYLNDIIIDKDEEILTIPCNKIFRLLTIEIAKQFQYSISSVVKQTFY